METMNISQSTASETLYPTKNLVQNDNKFQLKNQVRESDKNLISSFTRHQAVPPITFKRSSEYQPEPGHLGSLDRSKELERKSVLSYYSESK